MYINTDDSTEHPKKSDFWSPCTEAWNDNTWEDYEYCEGVKEISLVPFRDSFPAFAY
jgi:hypothetical protein